jgi:hypothetical protein
MTIFNYTIDQPPDASFFSKYLFGAPQAAGKAVFPMERGAW